MVTNIEWIDAIVSYDNVERIKSQSGKKTWIMRLTTVLTHQTDGKCLDFHLVGSAQHNYHDYAMQLTFKLSSCFNAHS